MIIFGMIKRQKKTAFMTVIFCMDCLKDEFERDALDPDRTAPGGALKWCGGTYVATTEAKQRRANGTCDVRFSAHRAPGSRHATYA